MSTVIEVTLLGGPHIRVDGLEVTLGSRKAVALLAYLALNPEGATREQLAELLWTPGKLGSVRQALYELRKLPDADAWLEEREGRVRVRASTDVEAFEDAVATGEHGEALECWGGPLLAGIDKPGAGPFREWLAVEQARLDMARLEVMQLRAAELEREGLTADALAMVDALLAADPLNETAYRSAMWLHYQLGHPAEAVAAFERCRGVLRRELDAAPLPVTIELADAIGRGLPLPVHAAVQALPDRLQRLLQAVAVGRGELGAAALAHTLERDPYEVAAGLVELERRRLLNAHHGVARHILYDTATTTPAPVARLMHERIAQWLEADGAGPGAVARHWLGAHRPDRAAPLLLEAAEAAAAEGDPGATLRRCYRALWAAEGEPRVSLRALFLLEGAAAQRQELETQEAALGAAERIARKGQDDRDLIEVRLRRSRQRLAQGRVEDGLELARRALDAAERVSDARLISRARNGLGGALFYAGRMEEAEDAFASNLDADNATEQFRARNNLGAIAGMRGDFARSYQHFEVALTLARSEGRRDDVGACLNNLAATAERMALYRRAAQHLEEARQLARDRGNQAYEARLLANLAAVYVKQGALGPAWNTAAEVEEMATERGDDRMRAQALELRAEVARHCFADERAEALFLEAEGIVRGLGDERKARQLAGQLAVMREAAAAPMERAEDVLTAMEDAGQQDLAAWLWLECSLRAPDAADAARYAERGAAAPGNPHRASLARGARAWAQWRAGAAGAAAELARAADALESLGAVEATLMWRLAARAASSTEDADAAREREAALTAAQAPGLPALLRRSLAA